MRKQLLRVPNKMNRSNENEHFSSLARKAKQAIRGWSMQPDAVQRRNKPFECRVILLGALDLMLCISILLAGCTNPQANSTAPKMQPDTTPAAGLQNVLRRAHQHKTISEDWGSLSWVASKTLGNAEGLTVGRATIKPGQTNPRHRHPKSEEVLYLLKGRIIHTLDNRTITMSAGDVITIAPGVFHNASCIGSEEAEMIVVYSLGTRDFELE